MKRKSYAKVNIFLKIEGRNAGYHIINSRFMKVKNLYDEIEFKEGTFHILGLEDVPMRENSIFKAYLALTKRYPEIKKYFIDKQIHIKKNIPQMAGLGGGSSNAATFLNMVNEDSGLNLSKEELAEIGKEVGADVPFFIYDVDVANVKGIGEIIEPLDEEAIELEIFTPPIECETAKVYDALRNDYNFIPQKSDFDKIDTKTLLNNYSNRDLNDLLKPAMTICPDLFKYAEFGFMSGSGSSFFKVKE